MWLDREIDPDEYRSLVQERLINQYPVFSQRIRPSRNPLFMPHWEDDTDFDLDYHVDVIQLPEPGDRAALEALISEQRSEMLRPQPAAVAVPPDPGLRGSVGDPHSDPARDR